MQNDFFNLQTITLTLLFTERCKSAESIANGNLAMIFEGKITQLNRGFHNQIGALPPPLEMEQSPVHNTN